MSQAPSCPIILPQPQVDGLVWYGLDRAVKQVPGGIGTIFRRLDINMATIGQSGAFEPLQKYLSFFELGALLGGDPHFGLKVGAATRARRSGLPGFILLNSSSLGRGLQNLFDAMPVLVDGLDLALVHDPETETTTLRHDVTMVAPPAHRQFTDQAAGYFTSMIREILGRRWTPQQVLFKDGPAGDLKYYRRVFGCPVHFHQPLNGIVFDRTLTDRRIVGADPLLLRLLKQQVTDRLNRPRPAKSLTDTLTSIIREGLQQNRTDIAYLAARLDMAERTFQKLLQGQGLSYRSLLEKVRLDLARQWLDDQDLTVAQIADRLGYAETSAFSRAFKRQHGSSPSQFRKDQD